MKADFYNSNEKKFEKLISLLKELPQDKAPDDFEFKLMTKIRNGNLRLNESQRNKWWTLWIIVPTFTLTAAIVVLFFVFNSTVTRSEEHTSELQSHSFISYAVFCLKKKILYLSFSFFPFFLL